MKKKQVYVMGIKASNEKFKELYEDYKVDIDNSKLERLHEDVYGLYYYFINGEDNPTGLIVGFTGSEDVDGSSESDIIKRFKSIHNSWNYDYESHVQEFLSTNEKMSLFKMEVEE